MKADRRAFLLKTCSLAVGSLVAVGGRGQASAAEHAGDQQMMGHGAADGYVMRSDVTQHCATCEFWGGPTAARAR